MEVSFFENRSFTVIAGGHSVRPSRVNCQMGDDLSQLVLLESIFQRLVDMKPQLFRTIHDQHSSHHYQTSITLRKFLAIPDLVKEQAICQFNQVGSEIAVLFMLH